MKSQEYKAKDDTKVEEKETPEEALDNADENEDIQGLVFPQLKLVFPPPLVFPLPVVCKGEGS